MSKEKISIIVPTYNRAATIGKTIDTFITQTFKDWEMIVVDDLSKDNTREVVEEYNKRDSRINYLLNERKKGAQGARNTGLLHAKEDWVVLFDSDDLAYPNYLETLHAHANSETDVITCYARKVDLSTNDTEIEDWGGDGNVEKALMESEIYVGMDACMIRKSKLFEIGLLDENCPAFQEFDTHIRLSRVANYFWVKEPLLDYLWGGNDTMSVNAKNNQRGFYYVLLHNQKRWKEIAYDAYHAQLMKLFRHAPIKIKWKFIMSDSKILRDLPNLYYQAAKRFAKRILKK